MILYPIVPIFSLFALLWVGPQNDPERISKMLESTIFESKQGLEWSISRQEAYYQIEYLAKTARAIAGGIASPLQLIFQVSYFHFC